MWCLFQIEEIRQNKDPQIFHQSTSHLQILGSVGVTWSSFHTEDPTILEGPLNLTVIWRFLLGVCQLIHIFTCKEKKLATILLRILAVTVQNLDARDLLNPALPTSDRNYRDWIGSQNPPNQGYEPFTSISLVFTTRQFQTVLYDFYTECS